MNLPPSTPRQRKNAARAARQRPPRQDDRQKPTVTIPTDLQELIARRAYELYVEHGYRHGSSLEDWLEAEREILSRSSPV